MRAAISFLVVAIVACNDPGGSCTMATQGCGCTTAGLCDPGLVCVAAVCVDSTDTVTDPDAPADTAIDAPVDDAAVEVECNSDADCDDTDPCTTDSCDLDFNECVHGDLDADGDGYAAMQAGSSTCTGGSDCDDGDPLVNPGATEQCMDGVDQDCDGLMEGPLPMLEDLAVPIYAFSPSKVELVWTGSEYGLAWDDYVGDLVVYFTRMDESGAPLGSPELIGWTSEFSIPFSMAWTGSGFAVTWTSSASSSSVLSLALLDASGNRIGSDIPVVSSSADQFMEHDIVWTGTGFGLVWETYIAAELDWEVFFARLSPAGAVLGSTVRVTESSGKSGYPQVTWTGSAYGLTWEDDESWSPDIYFARLSSAGAPAGSATRLTAAPGNSWTPSPAWTGSEWGVAWYDDRTGDPEIMFARVSASGTKIGTEIAVTDLPGEVEQPRLGWTGSEFGLAWIDRRDIMNSELYYARLSGDGLATGPELRVTNAPDESAYPFLAWSGSGFGLAWTDYRTGAALVYYNHLGFCN